jgi:hypothetical protein
MALPKPDRQYSLITDAATGRAEEPGGLGVIFTKIDNQGKHFAISFAFRQLKDHKNYSPFLLEATAANGAWKFSINIYEGNNSSCSLTTNHLKN